MEIIMTAAGKPLVPGFAVHPGELMREILTDHLKMLVAEACRFPGRRSMPFSTAPAA
jgi:hypothetical protein